MFLGLLRFMVTKALLYYGSYSGLECLPRGHVECQATPPSLLYLSYQSSKMYSNKSMGSTALKRLMTEYKELTLNAPEGITAGPVTEDSFFEWEALIAGPEGTPYEGGIFPATLTFPRDYPLSPPAMKFTCDMFHPNGISSRQHSPVSL
ncbi:hypothetical protein BC938DRAFT_476271 [Jimgerdemannia flammicorona]|uniref:UBC core domain-containing protein n=1 Tax=Jimgerdemannia flammicorona TaxID=994334 RepID=A0A433QQP5_9FUNG|nr:hypothetical protein BC938DRAFT_476271 [Jimgerdemannia flammicorona]